MKELAPLMGKTGLGEDRFERRQVPPWPGFLHSQGTGPHPVSTFESLGRLGTSSAESPPVEGLSGRRDAAQSCLVILTRGQSTASVTQTMSPS